MSGDGAGILIGALFLIGALPYILATAAAVAAAAGAIKVGKAAFSAAADHHQKVKLEVDECSAELSGLYAKLDAAVAKQDQMGDAFYKNLDEQMKAIEATTNEAVAASTQESVAEAQALLRDVRDRTSQALGAQRTEEFARIRRETEAETNKIMGELRHAQQVRVEAADWSLRTEAAQAQQRALAQSLIRDAKASIKLLRTMADSDGDPAFSAKVGVLEGSLETAETSLANGLLQASATSAQQIITRSATLALQHERTRSDRDFSRAALRGRLEGLRAELESLEWMDYVDERFGHVTEHMDDFTQGAFSKLMEDIDAQLEAISGDEGRLMSPELLELRLAGVEDELIPRADTVVRTGHERFAQFYERLHALSILEQHMKEQGYVCDWKQMAGDDATQKAVVHFTEPVTGNSIAVALDDEDPDKAELDRMAMEVMFYFANGQVVTEPEKERIRQGMLEALASEGLGGHVACTGSVNAESSDQTMRDQQSVQELPVRRLDIAADAAEE